MLLDSHCSVLKARSSSQDGASGIADGEVHDVNARKTGKASHLNVAPSAGTMDHVLPENSCRFSATTPQPVMTGDPGAVPPSPKSPNLPPASTRTKVFHWDVIPQDKV